jgi:peptidoglycan/xylan/chitin deacetylase (PgdA/CDA1 family)
MPHELILNFHGIGAPHPGIGADERAVWMSKDCFKNLLDATVDIGESRQVPIRITFDDGNESDAEVALPELSKRRLHATFFICSARIGAPGYLDRKSIADLLSAGMKIGSHGMHHVDWRRTGDTDLHDEIVTARQQIEAACSRPITEAAIPFGSYDRRVLTKLKEEGFARVYTSDRGVANPRGWLKPRNTLGVDAAPSEIEGIMRDASILSTFLRDVRMTFKRNRPSLQGG